MNADLLQVPIIVRREIETRIAGPLIKAFMKEFGKERTLAVVQEVVETIAREFGAQLASRFGGNTLDDWATKAMPIWENEDVCQTEILEKTKNKLSFNVVRCRFVELVKELGIQELGTTLFCNRDFAMYKSFNPKIKFTRTKTIMEGDDHCDFRCTIEEGEQNSKSNI